MGLAARANKPHYLFRPDQLVRRVLGAGSRPVVLPWGLSVDVDPAEAHGKALLRARVIDLATTEALFRLMPRGGVAIDAGANLGYMTSVLAFRGGPAGRVLAFEPMPATFAALRENVARWPADRVARVELHELALSSADGTASLQVPADHAANIGRASLERNGDGASIDVRVARLDDLVAEPVDVMKVDVEGHELDLLRGAERLLRDRRVRHIVFEEHRPYPTAVTDTLERYDYEILRLEQKLTGPSADTDVHAPPRLVYHPPNYLATLDPDAVLRAMAPRGWRALRPRAAVA
jgi:FkbM family methyltransferase